jgi:hypothetical protein
MTKHWTSQGNDENKDGEGTQDRRDTSEKPIPIAFFTPIEPPHQQRERHGKTDNWQGRPVASKAEGGGRGVQGGQKGGLAASDSLLEENFKK